MCRVEVVKSNSPRGYSGAMGGIYQVVGPRGFEPRTSARQSWDISPEEIIKEAKG